MAQKVLVNQGKTLTVITHFKSKGGDLEAILLDDYAILRGFVMMAELLKMTNKRCSL